MIADQSIAELAVGESYAVPTAGSYTQTIQELLAQEAASLSNQYTSLITSEFKTEKFLQLVWLLTQVVNYNTQLMTYMDWDVETATGVQLDYIGEWIGFSREIDTPISGVFFSFDDEANGFDLGYWQDTYSAAGITILPDNIYRRILYAKIAENSWDGSIPTAVIALQKIFPSCTIVVQDNQNMSMIIGLIGVIDGLTQALLNDGYFDIRPTGVQITYSSNTIFFGFDLDTTIIKGFDLGYFS